MQKRVCALLASREKSLQSVWRPSLASCRCSCAVRARDHSHFVYTCRCRSEPTTILQTLHRWKEATERTFKRSSSAKSTEKVATKVRVLHHETAFLRGVPSLILRTAAPSLTKFAIHSGEPLILGLKVTAIVTKRYLFTCLLSLLLSSLVVDRNRRWTASPKLVLSDAEAYANPHSRSHGVFSSTRLLKP